MKMKNKRILSLLLAVCLTLSSGITALADRVDADLNKPYLALGADLSDNEKQTVMGMLGLQDADLNNYTVETITNADEHAYLDAYLSSSVIGTRALSSVLVVGKESGYGVKVSTQNITYCTIGMYQNALITAGIEDADITVAGPFEISGTAALVGVVKAYEAMTGEEISEEALDVATNELVVTGELAESVGDSDKIEELIALVKQLMVENNIESKEDIENVVEQAADELDVTLTDEEVQQIISLMDKIKDLDLDLDSLLNQGKEIYDKLSGLDLDIDTEGTKNFFMKIVDAVANFFKNLFS